MTLHNSKTPKQLNIKIALAFGLVPTEAMLSFGGLGFLGDYKFEQIIAKKLKKINLNKF